MTSLLRPRKPFRVGVGVLPETDLPDITDENVFLEAVDRVYPDIAQRAKSSIAVTQEVFELATTDPDTFLSDLMSKGRTPDTEILLKGFGFQAEQIDQLFAEVEPIPAPPELPQVKSTFTRTIETFWGKELVGEVSKAIGKPYAAVRNEDVENYIIAHPEIWERVEARQREFPPATLLEEAEVFGRSLLKLPQRLRVAIWQASQGFGGASVTDKDEAARWVRTAEEDFGKFVREIAEEYEGRPTMLGMPLTDLASFSQNLAFSLTSMGAGLGVGVPIALTPLPGARVAAYVMGTTASGAVAYQLTTYQITQQYLELKNEEMIAERGRGLTQAEETKLKDEFASLARRYGLWEAIPEAISNLAFVSILTAPLTKMIGGGMARSILAKITSMYGQELLTETITQKGQSEVEIEAGLREGRITFLEAFKEIAFETFLLTTFMAGAGATIISSRQALIKTRESLKKEIGEEHPLFTEFMTKIREGFAEAIRSERGDIGGLPQQPMSRQEEEIIKRDLVDLKEKLTTAPAEEKTQIESRIAQLEGDLERGEALIVPEAVPEVTEVTPTTTVAEVVLESPVFTIRQRLVELFGEGRLTVSHSEFWGKLDSLNKSVAKLEEGSVAWRSIKQDIGFMKAHIEQQGLSRGIPKPPAVALEPIVHKGTEPEGIEIGDALSVRFEGVQEGIVPTTMMFTDVQQTGSTFTATSLEEAQTKLASMRETFAAAEVPVVEGGALPPSVPPTPIEAKLAADEVVTESIMETTGMTEPEDVVAKLTQLIKEAVPVREATEKLKHEELVKRTGRAAGILNTAEGREAFQKSKSALKGELPKADFAPPELQLTNSDITDLFNQIRESDSRYFEKLNTAEALETLLSGNIPTRGDIQLLEKMFGPDLAKAILDKRPLGAKTWETVLDVLNLPRAVLSSWDLSAPLRQGAPLFWGQPKQSIPAFAPMMKAAFSSKNAKLIDEIGRTSKYAQLREDAGLFEAPLFGVSAKLEQREEAFMSRLARFIPLVSASERAYVTYLNVLRRNVFDSYAAHWEGTGKTMKDYKSLASVINILSGRGPLGKLSGMGGILNATFFSPRYQAAKIVFPVEFLRATPVVRKMMARNILAFIAVNLTILALIKFAGGSVEDDPRSSDFGKGKIGNTRLDFWAGFQQYARTIAQMITEIRKVSTTGRLTEVERSEILGRFVQGKLSPVFGFVVDILKGESFMGEELSLEPEAVQEQAFNRLVPMFIQDLVEAIEDSGMTGALRAMPGMFGVGVQTYGGGYWEQFIDQLGQPQVTDTLPYSVIEEDIYTTKDLWRDALRRIKGVAIKDMTEQFGYPEIIKAIAHARDTKEVYQQRPNTELIRINADISEGDTFEHYFFQWQDYQRAKDKEQWLKDNPQYDKYYMGNFSRRHLDLLRQYHKLDKIKQEAFLEGLSEEDRDALTTDPRDEWLKSRSAANAELALWGQAKLFSMEAYKQTKSLAVKLDIPDNAFIDLLPSEEVAETYFKISDTRRSDILKKGTTKEIAEMYLEYSELYDAGTRGAHGRGEDFRRSHLELQQWGEINLNWKPIEGRKATAPTGIRAFEGLLR